MKDVCMTKEFNYEPSIQELLAVVILDPDARVTYPKAIYLPDENHWEEEWVVKKARDLCLAEIQAVSYTHLTLPTNREV